MLPVSHTCIILPVRLLAASMSTSNFHSGIHSCRVVTTQSSAQDNTLRTGLGGKASGVAERAGQAAKDLVKGTPVPDVSNNTETAVGNAKRSILGGRASLPSGLERNANKAADSAKDAARQVSCMGTCVSQYRKADDLVVTRIAQATFV